jgi:SAM-dependent methyltransferase
MADWQERITRDTKPSIRVEHDLRYAAAAPIVRAAAAWCDLGCGAGVAAADALADAQLGRLVLVDFDADALDQAGRDLTARDITRVQADLATDEGVAAVRAALGANDPGVITCFEVVEHLSTFVPLIDALIELAGAGWTVVLSVPNDAFWALENPYHHTMWGEGAFDELRRLLPADAVVARQIPLDGSHLVVEGTDAHALDVPPVTPRPDAVPSHFVVAFGPAAAQLTSRALTIPSDLDGRRTWERQRESTLAVLEAELEELRANVQWSSEEIARLNAQLTS